jgi:hypothetical protein
MQRYMLFLAAVLVALLLAIFWFGFEPNDERTQLVLHNSAGTIASGTKLGVRIGEPWAEADGEIRARFAPASVLWTHGRMVTDGGTGVYGGSVPVVVGEAQVSYKDDSWRSGWGCGGR